MQRHRGSLEAAFGEAIEQGLRQVQAGGGRGDGDLAGAVGVNGLIAFDVARAGGGGIGALDVGRKRDVAETVGDIDYGLAGGGGEANERGAFGIFGEDFTGEVVAVCKRGVHGEFFPGAHEAPPDVIALGGVRAEQETLDHAAGGAFGVETGGENGGVVAKEGVAGAEESWEVGERVVGDGARGAINDHETRTVATRGGGLRDEMRRQGVIEEIGR